MYRIAVLAEEKAERQYYAEIIARFCEDKGIFPKIMQYGEVSLKRQKNICLLMPSLHFPE